MKPCPTCGRVQDARDQAGCYWPRSSDCYRHALARSEERLAKLVAAVREERAAYWADYEADGTLDTRKRRREARAAVDRAMVEGGT